MSAKKMLRALGDSSAPIIPILSPEEDDTEEMDLDDGDGNEDERSDGALGGDDEAEGCPEALNNLIITPPQKRLSTNSSVRIAQEQLHELQPRKRKRDTPSLQKKRRNLPHSSENYSQSPRRSYSSIGQSSNGDNDHIGHHTGTPGTKIKDRYEIISQIGMGTFGKVFHCHDNKHKDMVAVKVVRSVKRYVDSAKIEADILDHIYDCQAKQKSNYCLKLYSHFELDKYYFLVTEKLGLSLYDVMKLNKYKGFPMRIIRHVSRQLLQAMKFLQSMNLIHTDLKVENVLFVGDIPSLLADSDTENAAVGNGKTQAIEEEGGDEKGGGSSRSSRGSKYSGREQELYPPSTQIKIIDFGGATYDNEKKSTIINTRQYRSPEVLLETKWSFPSDIWSVGCIIAEIYKGGLLFQTHDNLEHLALIDRCCGLFPYRMLKDSPVSRDYFDSRGNLKFSRLNSDSQRHVRSMQRLRDVFALDKHRRDRSGIADLMVELLEIDPGRRITASQALQMPFVR